MNFILFQLISNVKIYILSDFYSSLKLFSTTYHINNNNEKNYHEYDTNILQQYSKRKKN